MENQTSPYEITIHHVIVFMGLLFNKGGSVTIAELDKTVTFNIKHDPEAFNRLRDRLNDPERIALYSDIPKWAGLWYTSEGFFCLVKQNGIAQLVKDGALSPESPLIFVKDNGELSIGGKLMTKQRGSEQFVEGTLSIGWPNL